MSKVFFNEIPKRCVEEKFKVSLWFHRLCIGKNTTAVCPLLQQRIQSPHCQQFVCTSGAASQDHTAQGRAARIWSLLADTSRISTIEGNPIQWYEFCNYGAISRRLVSIHCSTAIWQRDTRGIQSARFPWRALALFCNHHLEDGHIGGICVLQRFPETPMHYSVLHHAVAPKKSCKPNLLGHTSFPNLSFYSRWTKKHIGHRMLWKSPKRDHMVLQSLATGRNGLKHEDIVTAFQTVGTPLTFVGWFATSRQDAKLWLLPVDHLLEMTYKWSRSCHEKAHVDFPHSQRLRK